MESISHPFPTPRKTKPRGRHPRNALSPAFVRNAVPGRYCDGNGLYLFVQSTGTRSWIQRLVVRGRQRELGLGSVHLVSLAEARAKALANRKLAREGGDPLAEKRRAQAVPTFAAAAALVVEQKRVGWRDAKYAGAWLSRLERHAFPRIGERPISQVNSADVLEILTPIWHVKAHTARSVRQRISAVMDWAVAMDYRADNPCDRVGPVLGRQQHLVEHMRALPHQEVAVAIDTVRASRSSAVVKLAFEFQVLTAARPGEVRGARWTEIDTGGRVWTIPATRMKANREHRVPLCRRAVEILEDARRFGDAGGLVFPSRGGRPLDEKRLRSLLKTNRIAAVPHGFRSSFRDWSWRPTIRGRLSRRRWPTRCRTRWRPPTRGRTCSSAGDGSWTTGRPTLPGRAGRWSLSVLPIPRGRARRREA